MPASSALRPALIPIAGSSALVSSRCRRGAPIVMRRFAAKQLSLPSRLAVGIEFWNLHHETGIVGGLQESFLQFGGKLVRDAGLAASVGFFCPFGNGLLGFGLLRI